MTAERKESSFYLPEDLGGKRPGLGVQLLSTAGFAWELKVRALLLVVFYSRLPQGHVWWWCWNPHFRRSLQSQVWPWVSEGMKSSINPLFSPDFIFLLDGMDWSKLGLTFNLLGLGFCHGWRLLLQLAAWLLRAQEGIAGRGGAGGCSDQKLGFTNARHFGGASGFEVLQILTSFGQKAVSSNQARPPYVADQRGMSESIGLPQPSCLLPAACLLPTVAA